MTVQAAFCPLSAQTLFDRNGCPLVGARVYAYDAGTTSARTTYADAGLTTANPYPARTNAYGRVPNMWLGVGAYKLVIKDDTNSLVDVIDGLPGGVTLADAAAPSGSDFSTGDLKSTLSDDAQDGWLVANGLTIGSDSSNATSRANADVQALYVALWNKIPSLVVTGGRGVSASSDFAAAKPLALPSLQGRVFLGCDGMGTALAGVLTAASTATPDVLGTLLGAETATLSVAQLPQFTPQVTVAAAGGFTPAGTLDQQGLHNHSGSTGSAGGHNHIYTGAQNVGTAANSAGNPYAAQVNAAATSSQPDHVHAIPSDGTHTHTFTGTAQADHTHSATAAQIGAGNAHANMPPAILGWWLIKI